MGHSADESLQAVNCASTDNTRVDSVRAAAENLFFSDSDEHRPASLKIFVKFVYRQPMLAAQQRTTQQEHSESAYFHKDSVVGLCTVYAMLNYSTLH